MTWPILACGSSQSLLLGRPVAIVNLALLLELAIGALPPGAEDEIVLIEHLPGRRVHLQEFFWTGVEDAPSWFVPNQVLTFYETHTVHHTATVYIPEYSSRPQNSDTESRKPFGCTSCIEPTPTLAADVDQHIGVLLEDDPGPRYWLLTVLKAGEGVPSKIELRLAKLYKTAFTRQQQTHLGLLPHIRPSKTYPKREIASLNHTNNIPEIIHSKKKTSDVLQMKEASLEDHEKDGLWGLRMRPVRIAKIRRELQVPELEIEPQVDRIGSNIGLVQVRLHNTSLTEIGATRLVYTVHLGGKPVPAETAAKDMALLSAQEVALELGAPVIVQSEPYLKESRPLALSKKRDAWVLIGATSVGVLVVVMVFAGLLLVTKRKRGQSSVAVPSHRRILVNDEECAGSRSGLENHAFGEATERVEVKSGRRGPTPGTMSITPVSQERVSIIDSETRDVSTESEMKDEQWMGQEPAMSWAAHNYAELPTTEGQGRRVQRRNVIDRSRFDFMDSGKPKTESCQKTLNSLDKDFGLKQTVEDDEEEEENEREEREEEMVAGSPHSYLSMPSCKQFPDVKSVEPLCKVLEPGIVKHLEIELDYPEAQGREYFCPEEHGDHFFSRASSAIKDPGVLGPIVWDLKRKRAVEGKFGSPEPELEPGGTAHGPVGRARRRLNELIEDSFHLFGSREAKQSRDHTPRQESSERLEQPDFQDPVRWQRDSLLSESRGKLTQLSHVVTMDCKEMLRPRTSLARNELEENIPETGLVGPHPRGAWSSRPLSAGPFHRPVLPKVDVVRVLANSQLHPDDPAIPLIAAIKKELMKFNYE